MLDEDFNKERAKLLHELALEADPFIRRRLLDLAKRYESPERRVIPLTPVDLQIKFRTSQGTER